MEAITDSDKSMQTPMPHLAGTLLIAALMSTEVTSALETSMILAALKTLIKSHSPAQVGWVVTSFLLASASSAVIGGRLGDIFGRRRVLLIMLACAAGGSLISALGQGFGWIILGRTIQGLSGGMLPLSYGIARELLPRERVAPTVGMLSSAVAFGIGGGLIIGGLLIDHFSYHGKRSLTPTFSY